LVEDKIIKNLFSKKSVPQNDGDNSSESEFDGDYIDKFYLSFPTLAGEPTYLLDESLSVGSEVGSVILDHPSLSPKHCTITLNQDVISILDHGSMEGTFINKKKIQSSRFYILQEKDNLKMGDLQFTVSKIPTPVFSESEVQPLRIEEPTQEIAINLIENPPDIPEDATQVTRLMTKNDVAKEVTPVNEVVTVDLDGEKDLEFQDTPEVEDKVKSVVVKAGGGVKLRDLSNSTVVFKIGKRKALNSLVRVLAIICEVLIVIIALGFTGVDPVLLEVSKDVYAAIGNIILPFYSEYLEAVVNEFLLDVPALKVIFKEAMEAVGSKEVFGLGIFLFFSLRIITTLLFGVSIGQFLLGGHAANGQLTRRLFGFIREIVGIVTFPFFYFFDIATLFSRRSFKEIITLTLIQPSGRLKTTLLVIVFIPLLLSLYLLIPMLDGLDFKSAISTSFTPFKASAQKEETVQVTSQYFGITGRFDQSFLFPEFELKRNGKKRSLLAKINIVSMDNGKSSELKKLKRFSLKELFKKSIEGNFLANQKFPILFSASNDVAYSNSNFKGHSFSNKKFHSEVLDLTAASMNLTFENLFEHLSTYGPFLSGFVEYRKSLENLVGSPIIQVKNISIGDVPCLVLKTSRGILFFRIDSPEADLFEVSVRDEKMLAKLFENIRFLKDESQYSNTAFSSFSAIDFFTRPTKLNADFFQLYYSFLYQKGADVIGGGNKLVENKFKKSLESILQMVKILKRNDTDKFIQNLSDLINAINENDQNFFAMPDVEKVSV
jgi:hypothetical protein